MKLRKMTLGDLVGCGLGLLGSGYGIAVLLTDVAAISGLVA
jgi:hypothetical protein